MIGTCRLLVRGGVAGSAGWRWSPTAAAGLGAAILAEADRVRPDAGRRRRIRLHAQTLRARLYRARGLRASDGRRSSRRESSTWRWRSGLPELRHRPALRPARDRRRRARRRGPGACLDVPPRPPIDPDGDPFAEGPRGPHAARGVSRSPGGAPDGRAGACASCRTSIPALGAGESPPGADPLAGGRGEPDLFAARPAAGAHEVIVNAPDPVRSLAELAPGQVEAAMGVWRERMRAPRRTPRTST